MAPGMADIDLVMQEGFSTAPEEIREMDLARYEAAKL